MTILEIAQAEMARRDALADEMMSIITTGFATGNGWVKRCVVQNYVYHSLGFHGRCGNGFARFINSIMEENGYRKGWHGGHRCYYGLTIK